MDDGRSTTVVGSCSAVGAEGTPDLHALLGLLGGSGFVALLAIAVGLVARRLAGALHDPLASPGLLLTAVGAGLLAIAITEVYRARLRQPDLIQRGVVAGGLLLALTLLAGAISLPGTSLVGLACLWGITGATVVWLLVRSIRPAVTHLGQVPVADSAASTHASETQPVRIDSNTFGIATGETSELDRFPDDIDQQLTRGRDESGHPYVQGVARVFMPAGHRSMHLHLAICPPLEKAPSVQVEQIDGPAASISVGMALPQGVRFDVRRLESVEDDESVILEFYGR